MQRRLTWRWLGLLSLALGLLIQAPVSAQTRNPQRANLTVTVTNVDGKPVSNATVSVASLGLTATTDAAGTAHFSLATSESQAIEVAVDAQGHRAWRLRNAQLIPNDTLLVDAPLTLANKVVDQQPEIIELQPHRLTSNVLQEASLNDAELNQIMAGTNTTPPSTIRVYRVSLGRIDTVNFKTYVKHVLPNEWVAGWRTESLRSGAMASKTYAWYRTMYPKYPGKGYDTKDTTADQVYNPNVSYASTNAAVDDTWNYRLIKNNAIFQSQYCAGSYNGSRTSGQCSQNHGWTVGLYMSQWGSKYLADNGSTWRSILTFYYDNVTIGTIAGGTTPSLPAWPSLRNGSSGNDVKAAQHLLRSHGHSLTADGAFGAGTEQAVRNFQSANGLTADGIIGPQTYAKLIKTVQNGSSGDAVRAIQTLLGLTVDGAFGAGTEQAVLNVQSTYGLTRDGIVGPITWQAAFGK
ncbi:peptidoglycan-binding protein [Herpetosiphon gulosus]|uniref:SpoIID/LytB domain-containing protein n=1 Tax=Herpetosiphon gulosus TaxID=1973496 RepID=A0ABP9X197_9CHLR